MIPGYRTLFFLLSDIEHKLFVRIGCLRCTKSHQIQLNTESEVSVSYQLKIDAGVSQVEFCRSHTKMQKSSFSYDVLNSNLTQQKALLQHGEILKQKQVILIKGRSIKLQVYGCHGIPHNWNWGKESKREDLTNTDIMTFGHESEIREQREQVSVYGRMVKSRYLYSGSSVSQKCVHGLWVIPQKFLRMLEIVIQLNHTNISSYDQLQVRDISQRQ